MTHALLLIDIQNDYFPGGLYPLSEPQAAADKAAQVLAAYRAQGKPVIHIQHIATRPGATFFLPDSLGAEIHASVAPLPGEAVLTKAYPNSFRETGLQALLTQLNVTHLTVAGMMTHRCVDTTVRAAFDLGYQIELIHDACATRDLSHAGTDVPAAQVQVAYMAALSVGFARVVTAATCRPELPAPAA